MRRLWIAGVFAAVLAAGAASANGPPPAEGEWLAGDLHVHTCYSHDAWCPPDDDNTGPDEFYTYSLTVDQQFTIASARGLDYLAITDHNDIRSQGHPGFGAGGIIPIRGYENSLHGHAQMLGAGQIYDAGDRSASAVNVMADALREDGGVFQINHPTNGSTDWPDDPDWEYAFEVTPDTVEVWNINRAWQPPAPSGSSTDDSVTYWEDWLDLGVRAAATGGSDNHWLSTNAVQGPGQPTTWVFASDPTESEVLRGLKRGHTFITYQPPALRGPLLFLEGDGDGDGTFESIVGDKIKRDSPLRVRVLGAPGTLLRVVAGGSVVFEDRPVAGDPFSHVFSVTGTPRWVRAEIYEPDAVAARRGSCNALLGGETTYCRNSLGVLAMTSALFLH